MSFPRRRESKGTGGVRPLRLRKGARTSGAQRTDTRAGDARGGVGAANNWQSIPLAPLRSTKGGLSIIPAKAGIQKGGADHGNHFPSCPSWFKPPFATCVIFVYH